MRFKKTRSTIGWASILFGVLIILVTVAAVATAQQILPVRVDRWLEVQQLQGTVTYRRGQTSQPAQVRTRLERVGDTIITGQRSSATLVVDTGVGTLNIAESTTLQVQKLDVAPDGGQITQLQVMGGQVHLQVRPFTHRSSELEIQTPAGVSGVRGTNFGVSVQPNGTTGVATLEGSVSAAAQGQAVKVDAGLQSLIVPGEPPSPPAALKDDPQLNITLLAALNPATARIVGQIDPVNLLVVADQPQMISRSGEFDVQIPLPSNRRIRAAVTTPLGTRQVYELAVP
ncbi:MAG TPA: FecR family protein [Coleofasciculaceae cyanobacterium]